MALFSDLLKMGSEQLGSFALADSKTSIMVMAIEARLKEIADILNNDLVVDLFQRNKWPTDELPKIAFGDVNEFDLDKFSSAVQRIFAVGAVEYRQDVMNIIREKAFNLPPLEGDVDMERIPAAQSKSGEGMSSGMNNGTGSSTGGKGNASTANKA